MSETQDLEQTPSQTSAPEETEGPSKGLFHRLQHAAHRKFPRFISDPDYRHRLAVWRRRDDEENARSEPPTDELVDLCCIWAVEFYTPVHIDKLLAGFTSLGWDQKDDSIPGGNPAAWVQRFREGPYGGGWFNLGLIDRPGRNRFFRDHRTASLPKDAEFALGALFAVTSSITCIVMGFVLKEEAARRFDEALRRTYETHMEPRKRGYSIIRPPQQKEAAIRTIRGEMRTSAADWFRTYLPGLFSSGILGDEFPTCELVTLRKARPFPKREEGAARPGEYLGLLDIDLDMDAWEAVDMPGLKFTWPLFRNQDTKFHAILAANENDFDQEKLRGYGGADRSSYAIYLDEHIRGLLSRWALLPVLSGFERHLNAIRDSTTFRPHRREKPLRVLETLGKLVSQSVDIAAVSSELRRFTNEPHSFAYEVETFKPSDPRFYRDENTTLAKILRKTVGERAEWLGNADHSIRDLMIQYGTAIGARENIRIQQNVRRLTWTMVALTILIAMLTATMVYEALREYESWSEVIDGLRRLLE
jgi:hypothetical protein